MSCASDLELAECIGLWYHVLGTRVGFALEYESIRWLFDILEGVFLFLVVQIDCKRCDDPLGICVYHSTCIGNGVRARVTPRDL